MSLKHPSHCVSLPDASSNGETHHRTRAEGQQGEAHISSDEEVSATAGPDTGQSYLDWLVRTALSSVPSVVTGTDDLENKVHKIAIGSSEIGETADIHLSDINSTNGNGDFLVKVSVDNHTSQEAGGWDRRYLVTARVVRDQSRSDGEAGDVKGEFQRFLDEDSTEKMRDEWVDVEEKLTSHEEAATKDTQGLADPAGDPYPAEPETSSQADTAVQPRGSVSREGGQE